jgi:DNA polymerase-3 subunit delta
MGSPAETLLADLAAGAIKPLYCLHGQESFLADRCLRALRAAVLGPGNDPATAFDADTFDLKETSLANVVDTARTLPMFSPRRWVLAHGIDTVKAADFEPLLRYLAAPNPRACLVLIGNKVDGRLKAFLALKKAGFLYEFARLKDRELSAWLTAEVKLRGLAAEPQALAALAEVAGPDLGRISNALEQVALYANGRIRLEHVDAMVPESRERSVFELTKAIAEGRAAVALRLLANLLRNREPALRIQYMLLRQVRQIWRAKELSSQGVSRNELASKIGIAPFYLDDILAPAKRMTVAQLRRSYRRLYQADRSLKSSRVDPDLQITRLVRQLVEDASARA